MFWFGGVFSDLCRRERERISCKTPLANTSEHQFLTQFSQMGFVFSACFLFFTLLCSCLASEEPNTDGFYLSNFFQKMGGAAPSSLDGGASSSFCAWKGVFCDAKMANVVTLSASGLGLSGPIPADTIGKLSKLESLDLSDNSITALASDFWGLGSSLRSLNLSLNRISGQLLNNIGNFGQMESLDLSRNAFSGEVPLGILGCKSLVAMDFSLNRLNGSVPKGFGATFKNLRSLNLAGNELSGRLPDLSGLESVSYLNLSRNMFQGSVLGVFREPLRIIDLSDNQFGGHISQVILSSTFNWSSLDYLDVSGNQLSGVFSGDWRHARSLKHLNLAFNRFNHQKFPQMHHLSGLQYLNLSHTSITGRIPTEISHLVSLTILDLSQNHLTGQVPDLSIENLQVLDLSMNNLAGEIPLALQEKLLNMDHFNFSYNNVTLCAVNIPPKTFTTLFIGCRNDCPIAVKPDLVRTGTKHKGIKLALVLALSAFFIIVGAVCLALSCRKRTTSLTVKQLSYKEDRNISGPFSFQTDSTTWVADVKLAISVPVIIFEKPLLNFTFVDLLSATSHFDRGTLLAEGRFGPVYRGFLPGGVHVAVKVLVHGFTMTDQEAARELERLGRIKHPNLVPLAGYCLAGDQRIAIYDYMENGSLQNLLHDLPLGVQTTEDWSNDTWENDNDGIQGITTEGRTTWRFRHKIALGTARALAFLHHGCFPQIIHRDVKASSVYLDSSLEPRLSDSGLAHIVVSSSEEGISRGSPGYAPPELVESESAAATAKSDVYGFGVILFELITGKKPLGDEYPEDKEATLVGWARSLVRKNQGLRAIDHKIRGTGSEKQMVEALRIAYLCTADLPSKRPSMQQIVGLLKDIEPAVAD